jgi:cytochrome c nitrite reductase small subunit
LFCILNFVIIVASPKKMKIPIIIGIVFLFAAVGLGMYFSDFSVFLGSDPAACNKCHVMDAQYEGWNKSTHREWAVCSECHAPHAFIPKYYIKMKSGLNDVIHFTLGDIPAPLRAHESTGNWVIFQLPCARTKVRGRSFKRIASVAIPRRSR